MGIVHRDLKYENIMFENSSDLAEIKVIDFGLSKKFAGKPGDMTERVGTMYVLVLILLLMRDRGSVLLARVRILRIVLIFFWGQLHDGTTGFARRVLFPGRYVVHWCDFLHAAFNFETFLQQKQTSDDRFDHAW
jgi:hypothetical protein